MQLLSAIGAGAAGLLLVASCGGRRPGTEVARLRTLVRAGSPAERRQAVLRLGRLGPLARDAIPELVAALADEPVRFAVIAALGRIGRAAVPALAGALGDPRLDGPVRDTLRALGETILPDLVRLARGGTQEGRREALDALLEIGPSGVAGLCQLARDPALRADVAWGLGRLETKHLRALLAALGDAPEDVRRWVIPRIWRDAPVPGQPDPVALLPGLGPEATREGSAIALAAIGPKAVPDLVMTLGFAKLRAGAGYALELMGKAILAQLRTAARDPARAALRGRIEELIARIERAGG